MKTIFNSLLVLAAIAFSAFAFTACEDEPDKYEITIYSSCVNADKGIYYYRTYDNSQINAVDMHREDLDSSELISYPMIEKQNVNYQN